MIIVTGGAGFIGSAFVWKLNCEGIDDILVVDDLDKTEKWKNLAGRKFTDYIQKDEFIKDLKEDKFHDIKAIIHMGACSSTTETDSGYLMNNNFSYTKDLAKWAYSRNVRFIYASSAATYGDGSKGFSDEDEVTMNLIPMNIYGYSKHLFDLWAKRNKIADKIAGLKFFNVFGPNEYHKADMTSVVFKSFHQIKKTGKVKLFKSHLPEYKHGEQNRDFIYIKDCVEIIWWLTQNEQVNGLFNLGTGQARTWNALAGSVFSAMGIPEIIEYAEMPDSVKEQYQYHTEAKMEKLKNTGCPIEFRSLEEAVRDYVAEYLLKKNSYL